MDQSGPQPSAKVDENPELDTGTTVLLDLRNDAGLFSAHKSDESRKMPMQLSGFLENRAAMEQMDPPTKLLILN